MILLFVGLSTFTQNITLHPCAFEIVYQPHPLYPPLLKKERGKEERRAKPLLDSLSG